MQNQQSEIEIDGTKEPEQVHQNIDSKSQKGYENSMNSSISSSELDLGALEGGGAVTICCPKPCQRAGGLCFAFPDWVWSYMYIILVCITLILICISLNFFVPHTSYNLFTKRDGNPLDYCMELSRWILYIVGSCMLYILSAIFIELIICIIRNIQTIFHLSSKNSNRMEYVSGTKRYIILALFLIFLYIYTPYIIIDNDKQLRQPIPYATNVTLVNTKTNSMIDRIKSNNDKKMVIDESQTELITNYNFVFYWNKFILALLIFSCLLVFEKLCIQSISVDFHKKAFETRVDVLNRKFLILDYLVRIAARNTSEISIYGQVLLDQSHMELAPSKAIPSLYSIDLSGAEKTKKHLQNLFTDIEAKSTAKMLLDFFAHGKKEFDIQDMGSYFRNNDNQKILELFSEQDEFSDDAFIVSEKKDESKIITSKQLRNSVVKLFQERCDLFSSIHDHGKIVSKFDNIITFAIIFISFVIGCLLFQISLKAFLSSVGTFALSFTFIFGSFAKNIFEDFVFILSSHLYDVGDAIIIDGELYTCQKIEILTTTFVRWDGQLIYIPTQQLITKNIMNVRRSGMQTESIELIMPSNTSVENVSKLRKQVSETLSQEKNNFTGKVSLGAFEHSDTTVKTKLLIEHGSNFSDMSKRLHRHNKAIQVIKDQTSALGISCSKIQ